MLFLSLFLQYLPWQMLSNLNHTKQMLSLLIVEGKCVIFTPNQLQREAANGCTCIE